VGAPPSFLLPPVPLPLHEHMNLPKSRLSESSYVFDRQRNEPHFDFSYPVLFLLPPSRRFFSFQRIGKNFFFCPSFHESLSLLSDSAVSRIVLMWSFLRHCSSEDRAFPNLQHAPSMRQVLTILTRLLWGVPFLEVLANPLFLLPRK